MILQSFKKTAIKTIIQHILTRSGVARKLRVFSVSGLHICPKNPTNNSILYNEYIGTNSQDSMDGLQIVYTLNTNKNHNIPKPKRSIT